MVKNADVIGGTDVIEEAPTIILNTTKFGTKNYEIGTNKDKVGTNSGTNNSAIGTMRNDSGTIRNNKRNDAERYEEIEN